MRRPPITLKRKTSYLKPPSRKIKSDVKKKSVERKKNSKIYVKSSVNSPVLNKTAKLSLDAKTVNSNSKPAAGIKEGEKEQESFLTFREHKKYYRSNRRSQ